MPVFVRSTGSALSEGKLMEAMNMYLKNAGRFIGGALQLGGANGYNDLVT